MSGGPQGFWQSEWPRVEASVFTVLDLIMILFVQKLLYFLLIQFNVHVYVRIWLSSPKIWLCGA